METGYTYKFEFCVEESVRISAIQTPGTVDAVMRDRHGNAYWVVYWVNGERHQTWMYEWELAKPRPGGM